MGKMSGSKTGGAPTGPAASEEGTEQAEVAAQLTGEGGAWRRGKGPGQGAATSSCDMGS